MPVAERPRSEPAPVCQVRRICLMLAFGAACAGKPVRSDDSSVGGSGSVSPADCVSFDACGGDVVGSWALSSLCSDGSTNIASGLGPNCAVIEGNPTLKSDASYAFESDGTYAVSGSVSVSVKESLDDACAGSILERSASDACSLLNRQSALVGPTGVLAQCTFRNGTCTCSGTAVIAENEAGTYTVEGTSITLTPSSSGDPNATTTSSPLAGTSDFCIDRNTLTVRGVDGTIARLTR